MQKMENLFLPRIYADNATGVVTWSIEEGSSLPYGLSISSLEDGVGLISGTPNAPAKEYSFTIVAEDEAGVVSLNWYISML